MTTISAALKEKSIAGDGRMERLGEWFAAEYEPLLRFAYFVCSDRDVAADLVQECFVRVWRAGGRVEEEGFPTYARRTIANLARSRFRRMTAERRAVARVAAQPVRHVAPPDPESRDAVWSALQQLSRQQRAVAALRFYEHMSEPQIAATLGVSVGTVKKQLSRAMERCRATLGGASS